MPPIKSRFNMMLDAFGVTGKEIASMLHIDSSLVSKWKTGKRSLKRHSIYLNNIVDYFISLDSASNYKTIKGLLEHDYQTVSYSSPSEYSLALKHWLLLSSSADNGSGKIYDFMYKNKKGREHSYLVLHGNEGRREAVLNMLEIANSLPPNQEIWSFSQESPEWFLEDDAFSRKWAALNADLLAKGAQVNVIHPVDRQYRTLAISLLKWLPLHMMGNANPYYMPRYWESDFKTTLFLVRDNLLLFGMALGSSSKDSSLTLAFTNPEILNNAFHMLESMFNSAKPLFLKYGLKDYAEFTENLTFMAGANEPQYIFTQFPFVNILEPHEITKILIDNHVDPSTAESCTRACGTLRNDSLANGGNFFRYLLVPGQLAYLLTQERIHLDILSFLSGKAINISNQDFRTLLGKMIHTMRASTNYEVAFVEDNLVSHMEGVNMFVKKNASACVFGRKCGELPPLVLMTRESVVILSLFLYCDQIWEQLLPRNRDKEHITEQIRVMLETASPIRHF